jgi:purine-nucleoside phosphorylase
VQNGYTINVDLFVFNYPNEDAVVHSANKLDAYLADLASNIRTSGSTQAKLSFFGVASGITSTSPYCIDIVGHSMGGLVARYYIENLGKDENIRRLITIGTPHWGSGYADLSSMAGTDYHFICDHDLRRESRMFGGSFTTTLNCNALLTNCTNSAYTKQFRLPGTFAPVADFATLQKAVNAAEKLGVKPFVGNLLSSDNFYDDSASLADWQKMGVLAVEMEAAALYMNAARSGKKALAICTISDCPLTGGEECTALEREQTFNKMIEIALETADE